MKDVINPINTSDGLFHDGDQSTGALGTIVSAKFQNDVQSAVQNTQKEIISVIKAANPAVVLDQTKSDQLLTALKSLFLQTSNRFSEIAAAGPSAVAQALANLGLVDGSGVVGRLVKGTSVKSSMTFTYGANTSFVRFRAWSAGQGGGSGNATGPTTGGGSGAAGGYVEIIVKVAPGASIALTVGAGGSQATLNSGQQGAAGGSTIIAGLVSITGGALGTGGVPTVLDTSAVVSLLTIPGQGNQGGLGATSGGMGGVGGAASGSYGGLPHAASSGDDGGFPGGGAAGGTNGGTSYNFLGGKGANGLIIVEEYA